MSDDFLSAAVGALEGFRDVYVPRKNLEFEMDLRSKYKDKENARELELYKQKLPIQMATERSNEVFKSNLQLDREKQLIPLRTDESVKKFKTELPLKLEYAENMANAKNDAKLQKEVPKASGSYRDAIQSYDEVLSLAKKIKADPGLADATGVKAFLGSGNIPGSNAARVSTDIDTLKNKVLIGVMGKLKTLSQTGASGFGQLSNQEGEVMKNSIVNLNNKKIGYKDYQNNLDAFIQSIENSKNNIKETYRQNYGKFDSSVSENNDNSGNQTDEILKTLPTGSEFLGFE